MKAILMSIQPKWCEKIVNGEKTIEVRKTRPNLETPFKCYIYCTFPQKPVYDIWINRGTENRFLGNGKVIGEFVCDNIEKFVVGSLACDDVEKQACLSYKEICDYFYGENYDNTVRIGYGWHISALKIYAKPKELFEFRKPCPINIKNCPRCKLYSRHSGQCADIIYHAPQNWCYVEEVEELEE